MSEPAFLVAPDDTTYPTAAQIAEGLEFTVRWHNRMTVRGELDQDYAGIIEGIDRLIFLDSQLAALEVTPDRGWTVRIPGYEKAYTLDYKEAKDGPAETKWTVTDAEYSDD
ncbi:hypothetical protein [uncultured Sulfitobacter sp.]|uniref:hypothetical protein n=1 Tax=uncultured Sulfitobacter sp. TaxID=191468 RepID=UPI002592A0C1|nr:hypothetical protein [uncultured Sulfitobacter sp.]